MKRPYTQRLQQAQEAATSVRFWGQLLHLNIGLALLGLGIAVMLKAQLGVAPWPVFHEGVNLHTPLSFGQITQLTGLLMVLISYLVFKLRPGFGTICNMLLVGPWADFFRAQAWLAPADSVWLRLLQCLIGVALSGAATGLYISARLGAGPRDAFLLGLAKQFKMSVRRTRFVIEMSVLAIGFALGGPVGLGTLLFALLIGPMMQSSLRLFESIPGLRAPRAGTQAPKVS